MKILSAQQIREVDQCTIKNEGISSLDLMERAAIAAFQEILNFQIPGPFHLVCGTGNNGGDGLVIARKLLSSDFEVHVWIPAFSTSESPDFLSNLKRLEEIGAKVQKVERLPDNCSGGTIIDALFGTGLNRPLEGKYKDLVTSINALSTTVISIDLPSGMLPDEEHCQDPDAIVQATYTLSFECPKRAFLFPEQGRFAGIFTLVSIGWDQQCYDAQHTSEAFVLNEDIFPLIKKRPTFFYKNQAGHVMLIGGSRGKTGAILLAARAAFRSGSGLVTAHVPKGSSLACHAALPDLMVSEDSNEHHISQYPNMKGISVLAVGPGLGTSPESADVVKQVLWDFAGTVVLDADALNILSQNLRWLSAKRGHIILTPHPGEMKRLLNSEKYTISDVAAFAAKHNCIVVHKGAYSATVLPTGKVYYNSTGTPALSVAGTGDVLTGIIAALAGQGLSNENACLVGNFIHGKAAQASAEKLGERSVMASDVVEEILYRN
ncbi:MAG: NAD(P)H-hydrate dehydratase [Cryomorphaceae bacterium]|nr:NAD(P)H-hydrate dehydratase [Cryomorphaceae bacterium]